MPRRRRRRYNTPAPAVAETRMAVSERLALWRTRVELAKKLRETWETKFRVRELEEAYLGTQPYEDYQDDAWYNHFFATIRTQLPSLFFQTPSYRVRQRAGSPGQPSKRTAAIFETLLQSIAKEEHNLEVEGKLALLQAFFRVGCLKTCYDPRTIPNPQAGEPLTTTYLGTTVPLLDEQGQPMTEPATVLTDEVYAWEWVDARKLLLPNEGPSPRRWTWIGEEIEVLLEEAQDDARFPKSLRDQMVANATANVSLDPDATRPAPFAGEDTQPDEAMFRYIECWSISEKRLYVWAEGQPWSDEQFLLDEPYSPGVEDHPYAILSFLPMTAPRPSPWPLPMTYNWLPLQKEYNAARRQVTQAGNRAARKILYDQSTFPDSEEARKALNSSVDMEGVQINDLARPPIVFGGDTLSQDVTRSSAALQYDWRVITGATGQRLSGVRDANTATEASLTERAANLRDSDGQALVAMWLGVAGVKMLQLVRQTLTLDRWITMRGFNDREFKELLGSQGFQQSLVAQYGPQLGAVLPQILPQFPALQESLRRRLGEERPLKVTRQDLQFEMDVEVLPASLGVRTLEGERQSWLQFLTTIGQFPQLLQSRALLMETASKFQFLNEDVVDELLLLGQQMAQQAAQAAQAKVGGQPQRGPVPNGQLPPMAQQVL